MTLGNDVAQTYFSLDPPGDYRIEIRDGRVAMERLEHPTPVPDRPEYALQASPFVPSAGRAGDGRSRSGRPSDFSTFSSGRCPSRSPRRAAPLSSRFLFDGVNGLGIFL